MPLNFSAAHSSRITKRPRSKVPSLQRSASSPFASFGQRKPIKRSLSKPETADEDDDFFEDRLEETSIVRSLANDLSLRDVAQTIQYIRSHAFEAIPENGGFNSTRIADILNFRKSLPPIVTVAHVHALANSPTKTEREIAELTKTGTIKRIVIPGRGTGGSSVADGLVLLTDVESLLRQASALDQNNAARFLDNLKTNPLAQSISRRTFSSSDITVLMRAGFLTSSFQSSHSGNADSPLISVPSGKSTSVSSVSRAASGSMAAVGGEKAISDAGGRAGIRRSSSQLIAYSDQGTEVQPEQIPDSREDIRLSLPNTGPYLKLLTAARSQLVSLIMKSKFREMPVYLLRERWDGGVSGDDPAAKAKKYRGEFSGVLPSRTRKWKQFYGLSFDWVLAECLGAGLVEAFETRSVGRAVRVS